MRNDAMRGAAGSIVIASLLVATLGPLVELSAQQTPPAAGGAAARKNPPPPPPKAVWSRFSERELPPSVPEPTAEELAARFDLEVLGPQPPDGIVHYRHRGTGMLFVFVPGGATPMGSNYADIYSNVQVMDSVSRGKSDQKYLGTEQPQASIYTSSFFIGVYEVTNSEYRQFLNAAREGKVSPDCEWPLSNSATIHVPFLWDDPKYPFWGDRQPVVGINWTDAWAFARWMGGRLPTEAEWEKAARGPDGRIWPWGNHFDPMRANTAEAGNQRTLDVGTYPGGRSVYGCYDMAGNACEYCVDAYDGDSYRARPAKDPCLLVRAPPSNLRVVRGGRWNKFGVLHTARCTGRGQIQETVNYPPPDHPALEFSISQYLGTGVRVVLSPMIDLFPDGEIERLRAEAAAAHQRALERKRAGQPGGKETPTEPEDGAVPPAGGGGR